ncbi:MAG: carbon storage regulator [Planctomycetaceae bacterium]
MLVLTRQTSQAIHLGSEIVITVLRTSQGSVKLGIEAPPDVRIARAEICFEDGGPADCTQSPGACITAS